MTPSELLADPKNWTQFAFARDANGDVVHTRMPSAVSFCLSGALKKCCVPNRETVLDRIIKARGFWSVSDFNDDPSTKHADVLSVLKEAGL